MIKYYITILAVVFIIFLYNSITFRKRELQRLKKKIRDNFGSAPDREYTVEELNKIAYYYKVSKSKDFSIDQITWNDLDMDSIFMLVNNTYSSLGEEYLYKKLRMPCFEEKQLKKDEKLYSYFEEHTEKVYTLQEIFSGLGHTRNISMYEFIYRLEEVDRQGNLVHYVQSVLFLTSIVLLFTAPIIGIIAFFAVLIMNIGTYYKCKARIENYFICFAYLSDMIHCAEKIISIQDEEIDEYLEGLKDSAKKLKRVSNGSFLIASNGSHGSLGEIVMDYVRMIFHVDIIKFNAMLQKMIDNRASIDKMFEILGELEAAMAVASFRTMLQFYTVPEFKAEPCVSTEEVFHPLISEPVANSMDEKKCVLITGSNASGKSTFLKTIAINLILAQTIHTCTAGKFAMSFCKTYTSMALRDDLMSNESYFIVEIKSLKRILDAITKEVPVICFVDEVLRGTNTVERIAASSYILKYLSKKNVICFAATHDIELTNILEKDYSNYHFSEEVSDNDVLFNYKLNRGRATSRNAIKLLGVIGFDEEIVSKAEHMAEKFIDSGDWELS